ncbi:MAG: hypothetical protein WC455_17410 [Dehalococcoidia bacterium]|jgi:hypothetical protein
MEEKAEEREVTYTLPDIAAAWADYTRRKVILGTRDGKEIYAYLEGKRVDFSGLINARTVDVKTVISFPDFLRTKWVK